MVKSFPIDIAEGAAVRVVIAPDKFKGTLTAAEAAAAMARGWRSVRGQDDLVLLPVADGGDGTLDVVATATGADRIRTEVVDCLGRPVKAQWLRLGDGRAVVESAQVVGIARLDPEELAPLHASSYGLGQLLQAITTSGVDEVVIGLGGSATSDGGAGLAAALGARFLAEDGTNLRGDLPSLERLDAVVPGPDLGVAVTAATDVSNPLLGPDGAARCYGPQKGAGPAMVSLMERTLERFAERVERDLPGGPWRQIPGAGAAGGLGFGLMAFCGASIASGSAVMAELVGLPEQVSRAEVVLTGEGSLDAQTRWGKAPGHVRELARQAGSAVYAIAGHVSEAGAEGFDGTRELGPDGLGRAAELVQEQAAALARELSA